ncbi:MAG: DUF3943 domain-containing protein [Colwellia sp.]|nr:DUF3943 domain-containing protein [Colwellia sp.]
MTNQYFKKIFTPSFKTNLASKTIKSLSMFCLFSACQLQAEEECSEKNCEEQLESIYRHQITNSIWENQTVESDFYDSPYQVSLFSPQNGEDSERLWSQTKSVFGYGFGVIGLLYVLPESFTNWDKEDDDFIKWGENVKAGPLWDRDNAPVNWIGHPYFGSVYYQVARKSGYRQWDAFVYSFLMSTFYWEYGIEALAEVPSVQDLVITPVLGWAWGEWSFNQEQEIRRDGGEVWGSDILGSTALAFLDPIDSLGRGINNLFGHEIVKAGTGYISMKDVLVNGTDNTESYVQLNVAYTFGSGKRYSSTQATSYYNNTGDPIDYGIVGLSAGVGYVELDPKWNLDSGQTTEFSLGMYFSRSFSSRVSYSKAKLMDLDTGNEVNYEKYSLDGQYYFNSDENLRPYLTAGFGEMLRERDNEKKVFHVNAGLGLHYKITNNIAIQTDVRHYYSSRAKTSENAVALTIVYRLGKGEWY